MVIKIMEFGSAQFDAYLHHQNETFMLNNITGLKNIFSNY